MNPRKNGKNHFLVGQEMNGSTVVSCVETKSPSGNRWFKIHREFALKNGSQFWLDKLITREKGEETLADWLKEQAELKAKKEAAQAKAREMARLKMQAQNAANPSATPSPAQSERSVKTKMELPPKKHKPQAKALALAAPGGNSSTPLLPKPPKKKKPASLRTGPGQNTSTDVVKRPTKPTSLRMANLDHVDDDDVSPLPKKPASLGMIQERHDPNGKASHPRKDRKKEQQKSQTEERKRPELEKQRIMDAKQEVEEKARRKEEIRNAEHARRKAEEMARLQAEQKKMEEARREAEEAARREEEMKIAKKAKRDAENMARLKEEQRKMEETKRQAEEAARREEEIRITEKAKRDAEKMARLKEEERKMEEARREAEAAARREEEMKIAKKAKQEAEDMARLKEERKMEEARREAEEAARREEEMKIAKKAKRDAEDMARLKEEERKMEEARREAEEAARREEKLRVQKEQKRPKQKEGAKFVDDAEGDVSGDSLGGEDHVAKASSQPQQLSTPGTDELIARLPEHSGVRTSTIPLPYDEVLADSSSLMGLNDSDGEAKRRRKKKKEGTSSKSDGARRRKSKDKELGDPGSASSNLDLEDPLKGDRKKKKKKKRESKKTNTGSELEQSLSDLNADKATKKKAKKKKKDKDSSSRSPLKNEKETVVSNVHLQLEAMFQDSSEGQSGDDHAENDFNDSRNVSNTPFPNDDDSENGSAEFHVDPALLNHPLDNYSSDEPPSDPDDDVGYTRVAGWNDFDNSAIEVKQKASAARSSKAITEAPVDMVDQDSPEDLVLDYDDDVSKENIDFSSLDEVKEAFPTFSKIMGVWVERENKLLYKTPLETVAKRNETMKEVQVPTSPEAPSLGSMVRKWEAKFVKDEPERNDEAPKKLKNVWAEKLEFTKPFSKPSHKKSADEIKLIEDTVERSFAFKDLTPDEMAPIVDAFERVEYELGATIGEQGEPENFYSIVQSGEVNFHTDGSRVGTAIPGDAFGELALLYSAPRPTEAKAGGHQTVLLQIDQTNFRHIMREQMIKSEDEKLKLLQSVEVFSNLDESDLRQLGSAMVPHRFYKGDNLSATFTEAPFCLVQQGSVTATDVQIGPGQSFGEESIFSSRKKAVEIVAMSDGLAFTIDRGGFEKVFGDFDRVSMKYQDRQTLVSQRRRFWTYF